MTATAHCTHQVLVALGSQRAATVLAELLPLAAHPRAYVREGVMWVLCFMPAAMGRAFTPSIATSLPVVISGLSDEAEGVREVCVLLIHCYSVFTSCYCNCYTECQCEQC
jgi:hypothetical protein